MIGKGPKQSYWLVNNTFDIHVCNDKSLMIDFTENSTKVRGSTSDGISLGRGKIKIRLILKDKTERLVFILTNVFYFANSQTKFVSLSLLTNTKIYHHNKD